MRIPGEPDVPYEPRVGAGPLNALIPAPEGRPSRATTLIEAYMQDRLGIVEFILRADEYPAEDWIAEVDADAPSLLPE